MKNSLRFKFHIVYKSKLPDFEYFLSVCNLKPKLKRFFERERKLMSKLFYWIGSLRHVLRGEPEELEDLPGLPLGVLHQVLVQDDQVVVPLALEVVLHLWGDSLVKLGGFEFGFGKFAHNSVAIKLVNSNLG